MSALHLKFNFLCVFTKAAKCLLSKCSCYGQTLKETLALLCEQLRQNIINWGAEFAIQFFQKTKPTVEN